MLLVVPKMEFVCGENRDQGTMLPECVDDYVSEDNPVRVIDAYVENLDMEKLGFTKYEPNDTGRPMYNPKDLQKLYLVRVYEPCTFLATSGS